ncbi:MAG: site-2 protease family protein [Ignavibacteria bacterium]|nr:site-2 protease family protein [Ignavibacteria bacterium]
MDLDNFHIGLPYSLAILFVLGSHEFGHYFAARSHKVKATLPFFIPFPMTEIFLNFGTLGAVIKTQSPINTRRAMFDIGVAGPIAGFFACVVLLIYGFLNLPPAEFILTIHPDYFNQTTESNALALEFGTNLLYSSMQLLLTNPSAEFVPPMSEIYHYPYLCVGWFGLFVTAMNLIPVGQLDGGHIFYSMFGTNLHRKVADVTFALLMILGISGFVSEFFNLNFPIGWSGWVFWALILRFLIKLYHPEIYDPVGLDIKRKLIGYFAIIIFIISFTPVPFYIKFW